MISKVLLTLQSELNAYLDPKSESGEDRVVLIDGENLDPITFKLNTVSALLVNLEEETALRSADRYQRFEPEGTAVKAQPEIRLHLYVLFVARFKQYEDGLRYLSSIIEYFQNHRVLDQNNMPELSEKIDKLIVQLVTLPFAEQNEVWNALRTTYHPSVLYKVSQVVFRDEQATALVKIKEKDLKIIKTKEKDPRKAL